MKILELSESKKILVDILVSIDECCRKNSLNYSLAYGTLLGAVRHKGFIPWDDDIDLMMQRDQLDLFISLFQDSKYELITNKDPLWGWHYVRVCDKTTTVVFQNNYERVRQHGLWVAIFPVDNVPDNPKEWRNTKRKISFFFNLGRLKRSQWAPTGFIRNCVKMAGRVLLWPVKLETIARHEERCMKQYNGIDTINCFNKVIDYQVFPREIMKQFTDVEFEGHSFMSIKDWNQYLTIAYGDYLQLPPEKDRIPKHGYDVFEKEG